MLKIEKQRQDGYRALQNKTETCTDKKPLEKMKQQNEQQHPRQNQSRGGQGSTALLL